MAFDGHCVVLNICKSFFCAYFTLFTAISLLGASLCDFFPDCRRTLGDKVPERTRKIRAACGQKLNLFFLLPPGALCPQVCESAYSAPFLPL